MTDPDHPNPNPSQPPAAAQEPELQDQVDQLLDEVEALTKETLGESESAEARTPAEVPTTDPAKEQAADDVGLSSESALVQDGERTSVEEVAADVDQELDHMERLIGGIGGSTSPADSGTSDGAEAAAEVPAEVPDPEPPTGAENTTASDGDAIEAIDDKQPAPEPAVDAEPDSTPPDPAEGVDASLEKDIAEIVASTLDADPPTEADALIAGEIPSDPGGLLHADPETLESTESAKETTLDQDIDALLASSEVADLEAPSTDAPPPADPKDPTATTDRTAPKPEAAPQSDIDLESIPIWRVLKLKLKAKSRRLGLFVGRRGTDALVWLLDRIDAKIGNKLPPMARELIGYCALATLAMSIIALLIFLL
ncbi:MAG: hypothetical protein IID33_07455 [Planctomycetes bacterium]|nr:hypothetical protein [Planctomycetota bacterium]